MTANQYKVTISRTTYATNTFYVEAAGYEEAKEKAIQLAGNHDFGSGNAEYEIEDVEPDA